MTQIHGIATVTIDIAYQAKLRLCEESDAVVGLTETHIFSSVRFLKVCYALRRPYFVMADDALRSLMDPPKTG